jgi:hypothetical protein
MLSLSFLFILSCGNSNSGDTTRYHSKNDLVGTWQDTRPGSSQTSPTIKKTTTSGTSLTVETIYLLDTTDTYVFGKDGTYTETVIVDYSSNYDGTFQNEVGITYSQQWPPTFPTLYSGHAGKNYSTSNISGIWLYDTNEFMLTLDVTSSSTITNSYDGSGNLLNSSTQATNPDLLGSNSYEVTLIKKDNKNGADQISWYNPSVGTNAAIFTKSK